jgi:uncharacterized protein YceK
MDKDSWREYSRSHENMNVKLPLAIAFLFTILFVQGCGTIYAHTTSNKRPTSATPVYLGTRADVYMVEFVESWGAEHWKQPAGWGMMFFGLFVACDVPLSAIADTFMLPFDMQTPEPKEVSNAQAK